MDESRNERYGYTEEMAEADRQGWAARCTCVEGTRVKWSRGKASGEGLFVLCWLGLEETWTIELDNNTRVHLYPCFGDTMEPTRGD